MPSYTVADLQVQISQLLNVPSATNSVTTGADAAAVYQAGSNTAVTGYTARDGMTVLMNKKLADLVHDCLPLRGSFTVAWATTVAAYNFTNAIFVPVTYTGTAPWWPLNVAATQVITAGASAVPTNIAFCGEGYLRGFDPAYQTTPASAGGVAPPIVNPVPVEFFYQQGQRGMGLYPVPYVSGGGGTPVTVDALIDPKVFAYADTLTYLDAEAARLLVLETVKEIMLMNSEDQRMQARKEDVFREAAGIRAGLIARIDPLWITPEGPYSNLIAPKGK